MKDNRRRNVRKSAFRRIFGSLDRWIVGSLIASIPLDVPFQAPFKHHAIHMLSDKRAGPFKMEIESIQVERAGTPK